MKKAVDVTQHYLVPKHELLSEAEKKKLFQKYSITMKQLPKIMKDDPAILHLKPKPGDIVKVTRKSPTAGEAFFYRGVTNA